MWTSVASRLSIFSDVAFPVHSSITEKVPHEPNGDRNRDDEGSRECESHDILRGILGRPEEGTVNGRKGPYLRLARKAMSFGSFAHRLR